MSSSSSKIILIIEDDSKIVDLLERSVASLHYKSETAIDGELGLRLAEKGEYDLIILDVGLPGIGGLEICKRLRAKNDQTPILMLTARAEEIDKVLGLELGADDYVAKPFGVRELEARISALLRRSKYSQQSPESVLKGVLKFGPLAIDPEKHSVTLDGKVVDLTALEFSLLHFLASRPGSAVSKTRLIEEVWGYNIDNYSSTVTSNIRRLRIKIEPNPENPIFVKTAHGIGYRFAEASDFSDG